MYVCIHAKSTYTAVAVTVLLTSRRLKEKKKILRHKIGVGPPENPNLVLPRRQRDFSTQCWKPGSLEAPDCLPPHCDTVQRALRWTPPLCLFNGRGSAPLLKPSRTTSGLATHTPIRDSCFIMHPRSFTAERHSSSIKRGSDFVFLPPPQLLGPL